MILTFIVFQLLSFILPGLTQSEKKLIAPAVAGSAILFIVGIVALIELSGFGLVIYVALYFCVFH